MQNPAPNLREKLKLRHLDAQKDLHARHPHAKIFFDQKGLDLGKIRQHAAKLLAAGSLGGALLLAPPAHAEAPLRLPEPIVQALTAGGAALPDEPQNWLVSSLREVLPPISDRWGLPFLDQEEERVVGRIIERATKIPARASLEGEHLNTVYGITGYEQHLARYPGDNISLHNEFREAGMAPGLGGFGYFNEGGKLTPDATLREKYYLVAQLMYLPDWEKRVRYLVPWYKWRKMIMVNVENGNAVIGVMGDAGPAAWTGKHFGGSPEAMNVLGGPKYRNGRVLLYFVDDPENKIPLGPVDYTKLDIPVVKSI
ncbi:MAG: hypothetical protein Q7S60_02710 [bacterium]|nr:hypothetical protein [bacterium]